MKKIFRLFLVLMLCIGGNFLLVDAKAETLPTIDNEIIEAKCVGCLKLTGVNILDLETVSMKDKYIFYSNSDKHHGKCEDENSRYKIQYSISKMPYVFTDEFKIKNYGARLVCPCGYEYGTSDYPLTTSMVIGNSDWCKINVGDKNYYVHKSIMEEGENERRFFSSINGKLNLVTLDIGKINLYKNEECEVTCENVIQAHKIVESTGSQGYKFDNDMLVCKECSECDTCGEKVASNGMTQKESQISKYCPEHACSFIWDVMVSSDSIENLTCKSSKLEGFSYCNIHKCGECSGPVVGVNVNPIITAETPEHYSGSAESGYSNYCQNSFCYEVGCTAIRSGKAAGQEWCSNHINNCSYPNCSKEVSKKITKKLCDEHANVEVNTCKICKRRSIGDICVNCALCGHSEDKIRIENEYMLFSERYHGKKAICECGVVLIAQLEVHTDDNKDGICEVCLKNCYLVKDSTTTTIGKMQYLTIDGMGDGTYMLFGGNGEMHSLNETLNKYGVVMEGIDGTVILATTKETSITDRAGNNWKAGTNINVTVEQIKQSGVDHLQGYSSGSQPVIASASKLIDEGNKQIEEIVLYDGFFGVDTLPKDFEKVLDSGTKVTFYWTDAAAQYYGTAVDNLAKWSEMYPNLELIKLPDANHGTVVAKAQEHEGQEAPKSKKCTRCGKISKTEIINGYCSTCLVKISGEDYKETPKCDHSYDSTNKEYKWVTSAYHQVKTICTKCKYTKADNEIHKDSDKDGICDLCKNKIITNNKDDKDNNKCEHEYTISGYTFETVGFHKVNKVCSKCGEKTSENEIHKDLDEDGNCDLCKKVDESDNIISKMNFYTIAGTGDKSYMLFGGSDEMYSQKGTQNKFKSVLEDIEGKVIIATTTEKSDTTQYGQNWTKSTNIQVTVDQIKEAGIDHLQGYSSGSLLTIAAASALVQEGNTQIKEIILYDGFYGIQYIPEDFEKLIKSGTEITFYWTKEAAEMSRYKTVRSSVNNWAEEYSNLKLVEVTGANHGNVIEKAQAQL